MAWGGGISSVRFSVLSKGTWRGVRGPEIAFRCATLRSCLEGWRDRLEEFRRQGEGRLQFYEKGKGFPGMAWARKVRSWWG
eukprot:3726438-Rhodomonas_salina.2